MNYKVKGVIASISNKKALDNGAIVLDYVVNHTSENGYVTPYNFNLYKSKEYVDQIDNFLSFNKVGDSVQIEFTIRGREYNGKVYNSLSHWRVEKIDSNNNNINAKESKEEVADLPF